MEDQTQPTQSKFILTFLLLVILFVVTFSIAYFSSNLKQIRVTSFSECEKVSESIIQESYPRICRLPNGKAFTEEVTPPAVTIIPTLFENGRKCVTSGCNNEICQDSEDEPRASICIYREEFECYKSGKCEVQENGECGWTVTDELVACLNKI
jgi:hypothetical protein